MRHILFKRHLNLRSTSILLVNHKQKLTIFNDTKKLIDEMQANILNEDPRRDAMAVDTGCFMVA